MQKIVLGSLNLRKSHIISIKQKIFQNEFSKNILTLITGTTVAQFIPVVISPILTRIYTPKDFGVLTLFISISAILGSIATGRYELAIVLAENSEEAINITALSTLIAVAFGLFSLVVVILFNKQFTLFLNNKEIFIWLFFIPLVVFLTGLFNSLSNLNTREKQFKNIAKANINKSIILAAVQLALGFLNIKASGLICGQILSSVSGNSTLGVKFLKDKDLLAKINKEEIRRLAKRYINFPKYSTFSILMNTLSYNILNIFISTLYSTYTLGLYSLSNRVLGMPTSLIGSSVSQVFFQKATEEKEKTGSSINTFYATLKRLLLISVPCFGIIYLIVEDAFAFVFGEEWRIAGKYTKIVIPLFFVKFIVSPLTLVTIVFEKQKFELASQLTLLGLFLVTYFISLYNDYKVVNFLYLFTLTVSLFYVLWFFMLLKISKG